MIKRKFFSSGRTSSFFRNVSSGTPEIDLRAEYDTLIYGDDGEIAHGHLLVIRHMRRDAQGKKIDCTCKQKFTGEAEPDCPYCLGEAYLWDEKWYVGRSQYLGSDGGLGNRYRFTPPGEIRTDTKVFFLRYDTPIRYGDKIIEMLLDEEGDPVVPYVRESIYKPQTINRLRSDHGRTEFITVYCLEKDAIRPDEF